MSKQESESPDPDIEALIQQMAGLANLLDHAFSQIDTLRGQVNTLTRRLDRSTVVLGDGTHLVIKE